jgi:hypothetical protein
MRKFWLFWNGFFHERVQIRDYCLGMVVVEMEDSELVKGEAYCFHMDNDQNIDIDDALSYFVRVFIDVLGFILPWFDQFK